MSEVTQFISAHSLFAVLDEEGRRDVSRRAIRRRVKRGEQVLIEGEAPAAFFFVLHGHVRVFRLSSSGREQALLDVFPGQLFNLVPIIDGGPNPSSAVARSDGVLLGICREDFLELMDKYPALTHTVLLEFARRLRYMTSLVEDLSLRTVAERLARLLLEMAEHPEKAPARFTQQELATRLGTVREVISRTLKQFEKDGLIAMERHRVNIVDPERLAEMYGD